MEKIFLDHPWIFAVILLWTLPWKGSALWISARRGHVGWFLVLLVLNTLAILDILYIFVFSRWGTAKKVQEETQKQDEPEEVVRKPRFSSSSKSRSTIV
ncbi:MAG: hypothetical protein ACD_56C00159G0003 [uncultured bacterium]|nr:MAG: hypothetical protein ACD_56C00159G0003 [uncultured bacterium]